MQARRGPLAALLLLVGLVFSGFSGTAVAGIEDAAARPAQLRIGKGALGPRALVRTAANEDEGDRLDTPILRPDPPRATAETVDLHIAARACPGSTAARLSAPASPYRARAPPAHV